MENLNVRIAVFFAIAVFLGSITGGFVTDWIGVDSGSESILVRAIVYVGTSTIIYVLWVKYLKTPAMEG
tara:strand:+ start:2897 stop:3103 length:207 start_codon:yes stop_codon:yes gene_type:complete